MMKSIVKTVKEYKILLLALAVFVFMTATNAYYLSSANMYSIMDAMTSYGIIAIGLTFVIICGQMDVSSGSTMALACCTFAIMLKNGVPFFICVPLVLLLGVICGALSGFFVARFKLMPFVVTMCLSQMYRGIALVITNSLPVTASDPIFKAINSVRFGAVPGIFALLILALIIGECVLRFTQYGRNLYIIGGNIGVAENLGISVNRHVMSVFVIQGFCAAFAGLAMLTRTFSATGTIGDNVVMAIVPMVIIGGTTFSGGKGNMIYTFFGILFIRVVFNALSFMSLPGRVQEIIQGLIMLIVIVSNKYMENRYKKV